MCRTVNRVISSQVSWYVFGFAYPCPCDNISMSLVEVIMMMMMMMNNSSTVAALWSLSDTVTGSHQCFP